MTYAVFHNALRILLNIEYSEFERAVNDAQADLPANFPRDLPAEQWPRFRDNPFRWFIVAPDAQSKALWRIVEARNFVKKLAREK